MTCRFLVLRKLYCLLKESVVLWLQFIETYFFNTAEPPLTAASLQWPLILADSPYTDSCLNHHGHFLLPQGGRCVEVQLCCMSVDNRTICNSSHRWLLNIWRYSLYTDVVLFFFSFFWKTWASQPPQQALESSGRKRERARARETRESPSRAPVFSCAHYFQAPQYARYRRAREGGDLYFITRARRTLKRKQRVCEQATGDSKPIRLLKTPRLLSVYSCMPKVNEEGDHRLTSISHLVSSLKHLVTSESMTFFITNTFKGCFSQSRQ